MRTTVQALLAGFATAAVLVSGCSSAPDTPPDEPGDRSSVTISDPDPSPTPAIDPEAWGTSWARTETLPPLGGAEYVRSFTASGRYWIYNMQQRSQLHYTEDGITWGTIDLTDVGLPEAAVTQTDWAPCDNPVVDDRGDSFDLFFYVPHGGAHPQGLAMSPWLVTITGDEVAAVKDGASIGLETMPAAIDGWDFRTECPKGFVTVNDTRYLLGRGQWWQPYKTGNDDAYIATETADGMWSVYSSRAPFLGGEEQVDIHAVYAMDDRIVALSKPEHWDATGFIAWTSTDGQQWTAQHVEGGVDDFYRLDVVQYDGGVVVIGSGNSDETNVWHSSDSQTWNHHTLRDSKGNFVGAALGPLGPVLWVTGADGKAWRLDDNGEWISRIATGLPSTYAFVRTLPDGTVFGNAYADSVYISTQ